MRTLQTHQRGIRTALLIALGIALFYLLVHSPLLLVSANALALSGWIALQLVSIHRSAQQGPERSPRVLSNRSVNEPFFSIHVATHNEPAEVVCSTLDALARIRDAAFEVIVVDNNTSDRALWEPAGLHCKSLGDNFTFLHVMGVTGAKAGALNIARKHADVNTDYIVTVDADYRVTADFLALAQSILQQTDTDYLQFPQAYDIAFASQLPLANELGDYFDRHAQSTVSDSTMLLTGTLSVVSADALNQAGGWPTQTITEDAELGVKLQRLGFRGLFVNRFAGQGLLPPSVTELRKQRSRWITGNMHVLMHLLEFRSIRECDLSPVPSIDHCKVIISRVSQLTAWCAFVAVPYLVLALLPLLGIFIPSSFQGWQPVFVLCLISVAAQLLSFMALSRTQPGFIGVKWALVLPSSWATLLAPIKGSTRFRCTRRVAAAHDRAEQYVYVAYLPLATGFVCSAILNWWVAAAGSLILMSSAVFYLALDKDLREPHSAFSGPSDNERASHDGI